MAGEFTFASVGDLMIRRPASQLADPEVQEVFDLLRNADLAWAIWKGNWQTSRVYGPMKGFVGTHEVAADLKVMGIDMVIVLRTIYWILNSLVCFLLTHC
ncbi:MAG: hypothetical protein Ct9H300mP22_5490 [Gammaproteobacteria bacterium]|nr:MAG: hypothetical protein Ct9H300mP22_5490 [Gammaproteobacteria bacterium]